MQGDRARVKICGQSAFGLGAGKDGAAVVHAMTWLTGGDATRERTDYIAVFGYAAGTAYPSLAERVHSVGTSIGGIGHGCMASGTFD
jgi:hypothetical protein